MVEPEQSEPNKGLIDKLKAQGRDFDPDLSSYGFTPEMLKDARQLYEMSFVTKNPIDKMAGQLFYQDVDFEKDKAEDKAPEESKPE